MLQSVLTICKTRGAVNKVIEFEQTSAKIKWIHVARFTLKYSRTIRRIIRVMKMMKGAKKWGLSKQK